MFWCVNDILCPFSLSLSLSLSVTLSVHLSLHLSQSSLLGGREVIHMRSYAADSVCVCVCVSMSVSKSSSTGLPNVTVAMLCLCRSGFRQCTEPTTAVAKISIFQLFGHRLVCTFGSRRLVLRCLQDKGEMFLPDTLVNAWRLNRRIRMLMD